VPLAGCAEVVMTLRRPRSPSQLRTLPFALSIRREFRAVSR
jgi:hypothetical protein